MIAPHLDITYSPGVPIADYNATAPYFTTIQRHSYSSKDGTAGITGAYFTSTAEMERGTVDPDAAPTMTRNDWMLSFHFLNYG